MLGVTDRGGGGDLAEQCAGVGDLVEDTGVGVGEVEVPVGELLDVTEGGAGDPGTYHRKNDDGNLWARVPA